MKSKKAAIFAWSLAAAGAMPIFLPGRASADDKPASCSPRGLEEFTRLAAPELVEARRLDRVLNKAESTLLAAYGEFTVHKVTVNVSASEHPLAGLERDIMANCANWAARKAPSGDPVAPADVSVRDSHALSDLNDRLAALTQRANSCVTGWKILLDPNQVINLGLASNEQDANRKSETAERLLPEWKAGRQRVRDAYYEVQRLLERERNFDRCMDLASSSRFKRNLASLFRKAEEKDPGAKTRESGTKRFEGTLVVGQDARDRGEPAAGRAHD